MSWFADLNPIAQALLATLGTWLVTALGASLVIFMSAILPYALAFAAGAMIFVVVEELVPESQRHGNIDLATMGAIVGFAIMMTLDVALG
jgi:ZIP family zinc transporter